MSSSAIRDIQIALFSLGYDPQGIDGIFGDRTRAATERWLAAGGVSARVQPAAADYPIRQGSAGYRVTEICIHCSATRGEWMATSELPAQVAEIRRWHVQGNGWSDIGYHWLVGRRGDTMAGRPEDRIGAGVEGHNRGVIHICLIGGHGSSKTDDFSDHFTAAQDTALRRLIEDISKRADITRISGHNEYAAKACPGFSVPAWLKGA